jgi:5-deoxy-5-amino-3-dehydroquinate synthase
VAADEREAPDGQGAGGRAVLNYGHTLAHALETSGGHELRHGEAVAVGLVFAAHLAAVLGRIDEARVQEHVRVVKDYGLDVALPAAADREHLIELMARDKKAIEGLTFVLDGPDGVEVVAGVPRSTVEAAFERMGA